MEAVVGGLLISKCVALSMATRSTFFRLNADPANSKRPAAGNSFDGI